MDKTSWKRSHLPWDELNQCHQRSLFLRPQPLYKACDPGLSFSVVTSPHSTSPITVLIHPLSDFKSTSAQHHLPISTHTHPHLCTSILRPYNVPTFHPAIFISTMIFPTLSCLLLLVLVQLAAGATSTCSIVSKGGKQKYNYDPDSNAGPGLWGSIKGYEECSGSHQSPIDIVTQTRFQSMSSGPKEQVSKTASMKLYASTDNWGLSCDADSCGTTTYNGEEFTALSVHMHAPSEHTLNGVQYPLESHIVHANANQTQFVVLATLYEYDEGGVWPNGSPRKPKTNWGVQKLIRGARNPDQFVSVNLKSIAKPFKGTCTYFGSLTTPPCWEAVRFFVSFTPEKVTRKQVNDYVVSAGSGTLGNARPVQPINGRTVTCFA